MQEFKGTPGPYRVEECRNRGEVYEFAVRGNPNESQPYGTVIARVDFVDTPDICHVHGIEAARANAQLLAAAPELLEALQNLLEAYKECSRNLNAAWEDNESLAAVAAIAKATGEQA